MPLLLARALFTLCYCLHLSRAVQCQKGIGRVVLPAPASCLPQRHHVLSQMGTSQLLGRESAPEDMQTCSAHAKRCKGYLEPC